MALRKTTVCVRFGFTLTPSPGPGTYLAFGNVYYFLARSTFDFVTSRRGIDVNQPSRLRSAAELKLLLSFNSDISNGLRQQLNKGLEQLSVNPLENGTEAERRLALAQYHSLKAYALRPDGLPARLERQRGSEMTKFIHRGLKVSSCGLPTSSLWTVTLMMRN